MDYRQIDRIIRALKENRQDWINRLVDNPDSTAAQFIVKINAQIELLRSIRTYPEDYTGDYV